MATPPSAKPAEPERIVWHRHWLILLRAIYKPALAILALILVPLISGGIETPATRLAFLIGSALLFIQALSMWRSPSERNQTPLSQIQRALYRVARPIRAGAMFVALALAVATFLIDVLAFGSERAAALLPWLYGFWFGLVIFWLIFNAVDWRNDVYILTADRIIDQVRFPLLYDQRTEARLDQVQNVRYSQGFIAGLLNYGNVIVETAGGAQAVVFLQVPDPLGIQRAIFGRIDELNERRASKEAGQRREELARWFTAYHALTDRIEILSLPEQIEFRRTVRPDWRINVTPNTQYETWITYDSESHATDNQYDLETPHREGQGRAHFREFIPAMEPGYLYLKIWLRVLPPEGSEHEPEVFATREQSIRVIGGTMPVPE